MKTRRLLVLFACAALIASAAAAVENNGAAQIDISASRGTVSFPHHQHQEKVMDCNICHTLFPQEANAINKLKADGRLKPKQVMNKLCINCHRAEKNAGKAGGPTICSQCHSR
jgi:hypothetical protein